MPINTRSATEHINNILQHALNANASDIHIEPQAKLWRVRLRIDGLLHKFVELTKDSAERITAALKIMAHLDIAEKRLPQDGRFDFKSNNQSYDLRLATCPTLFGEKLVLRILNMEQNNLDLEALGLETNQYQILHKALQRPEGMILVTGPTGSGKTVTLYSCLNTINSIEKNICTVEDPIEIKLPGINQVAVQNKIGLDFSKTLRAFLRQDPDIIMLGEIRDGETAEIAIKAAQTGHLVLATLHTNSASEAVTRLLNTGISAFNIASSVTLIIAERLVRKLCQHCKIKVTNDNIFKASVGCEHCHHGYLGRTGVFELLPISKEITNLVIREQHAFNILPIAKQQGFQSLLEIAEQKVKHGLTSREEVLRIIHGQA